MTSPRRTAIIVEGPCVELPFTIDQFIGVFVSYNIAIWPAQLLLNAMAFATIVLSIKRFPQSDRIVSTILGLLWLWIGLVYHWAFFTAVNPAAFVFGILCVAQGGLFFWMAARAAMQYRVATHWRGSIGSVFVLYGLLIYPALGYVLGHVFPASPTFGAPCPTTIFTFGILLWARDVPRYLLIIPALWSLIGSSAAFSLGIREDFGLLVAGLVGTCVLWACAKPGVTGGAIR